MATIKFKDSEDFLLKLSKLGKNQDEIAKKAVYAGVSVVADRVRQNLIGVVSEGEASELVQSFGVTPIKVDEAGNYNAHVGFDGYDSKGVPNQMKARILESGASHIPKRPFVRPAVTATRKQALAAMQKVVEDEISKL